MVRFGIKHTVCVHFIILLVLLTVVIQLCVYTDSSELTIKRMMLYREILKKIIYNQLKAFLYEGLSIWL